MKRLGDLEVELKDSIKKERGNMNDRLKKKQELIDEMNRLMDVEHSSEQRILEI